MSKVFSGLSINIGSRANVENDGLLKPGTIHKLGIVTSANFYKSNGEWVNSYPHLAIERFNGQGTIWMQATSGTGGFFQKDYTLSEVLNQDTIGTVANESENGVEVFLNIVPQSVIVATPPPSRSVEDLSLEDI